MLVPDRVWALLTEDEQELIRQTINGERRKGREIICPHCEKIIKISTLVSVRAADGLDHETPKTPKAASSEPIRAKDEILIEAAKESGLFDAFSRAVIAEKEHSGVPANMEEHF